MFALVSRPWCLDRDDSVLVKGVGTIAAPRPVFRLLDEAAFHGISVDVLEVVDEFFMVTDVAVVITGLPER